MPLVLSVLATLLAVPATAETGCIKADAAKLGLSSTLAQETSFICSGHATVLPSSIHLSGRGDIVGQAAAPKKRSTLAGLNAVASGIDPAPLLVSSWGTGAIPSHDLYEGALRFLCAPGQRNTDDPILYPGQPGRSHLHQWFGNTAGDAHSTYASLRTSGNSTCNNALNRSAYWVPAMINGAGKVVVPDLFGVYYKRPPSKTAPCMRQPKGCVALPRGLRMVFGFNMQKPGASDPINERWWNCATGGKPGPYATITEAAENCPAGGQIEFVILSRPCWNGTELDSADHRSHLAFPIYDVCPETHPYRIPQITEEGFYTNDGTATDWSLSSDMGGPAGSTLHADWFGAWEDSIMDRWMASCIEKLLSCTGGDLGDGQQLKNMAEYGGPKLVEDLTQGSPASSLRAAAGSLQH